MGHQFCNVHHQKLNSHKIVAKSEFGISAKAKETWYFIRQMQKTISLLQSDLA